MKLDSLQATVQSLQRFLAQAQGGVQAGTMRVRSEAQRLRFPDPDLAARVARFLRGRAPAARAAAFSVDEVTEALLALLFEEDVDGLRGDGPVVHWRAAVRAASRNFGRGLTALFKAVSEHSEGKR